MVPLHQIALHILAAAALLLTAIYGPLLFRKPVPKVAEVAMILAGLALVGAVIVAIAVGHWPMRS